MAVRRHTCDVLPNPQTNYMSKFLLPVILLLALSSCDSIFSSRVRGNGTITTQVRNAGDFKNIDVSGAIDIIAKQDGATAVKVEADDNLQEYIVVSTDGNTLRIYPKEGFNLRPTKHIRVYVSAPSFDGFEASGACEVKSDGQVSSSNTMKFDLSGSCNIKMDVKCPKVDIGCSGASGIVLKGETKDFEISGSGSSDVKAFDLLAENVKVGISGAGDAQVYASVSLDVEISGAGSVKYKGNANVKQEVSGAGSVKKVE